MVLVLSSFHKAEIRDFGVCSDEGEKVVDLDVLRKSLLEILPPLQTDRQEVDGGNVKRELAGRKFAGSRGLLRRRCEHKDGFACKKTPSKQKKKSKIKTKANNPDQ